MRFPTMVSEVMDIIVKALSKERDYTLEIVESIIDSEQYYHFTNDDDYNTNRSGIVAGEGQGRPGPGGPNGQPPNPNMQNPNDPRNDPRHPQHDPRSQSIIVKPDLPFSGKGGSVFVAEMRKRIDEYFEIVLRSVKDSVPKACGFFLVRKSENVL